MAGFGGLGYELAVEAAARLVAGRKPTAPPRAPSICADAEWLVIVPTCAAMDVAGRLPRLAARLGELGCDGLLVTNLTNIRYLTGFTGSAGVLLVLPDESLLVSDGRYRDQSAEQVKAAGAPVRIEIGQPAGSSSAIEQAGEGPAAPRAGGRRHHLGRPAASRRSARARHEARRGARAVEALRAVKDEGELARIERAADIADVALAQVKELLCEAPTEEEFAIALDFEMRRRGAEAVAFESIVGERPERRPSPRSTVRSPHRGRRARRRRLRGDGRRLPVGHDPDGRASALPGPTSSASCSRRSSPRNAPGCAPSAPA